MISQKVKKIERFSHRDLKERQKIHLVTNFGGSNSFVAGVMNHKQLFVYESSQVRMPSLAIFPPSAGKLRRARYACAQTRHTCMQT